MSVLLSNSVCSRSYANSTDVAVVAVTTQTTVESAVLANHPEIDARSTIQRCLLICTIDLRHSSSQERTFHMDHSSRGMQVQTGVTASCVADSIFDLSVLLL